MDAEVHEYTGIFRQRDYFPIAAILQAPISSSNFQYYQNYIEDRIVGFCLAHVLKFAWLH